MKLVGALLLCYLVGSIPFSYLFTRIFTKQDIRNSGSGNVGATNVLRTAGPVAAFLALIGDVLKGVLAGWLALKGGGWFIVLCPLVVILGHCYPLPLKLKGGKGVATAAGVLLVLTPGILGVLVTMFIFMIIITRYVSMGSLTAALFLPVLIILWGKPWPYLVMGSLMALLVIFRHRTNLQRLRQGTEPAIGKN